MNENVRFSSQMAFDHVTRGDPSRAARAKNDQGQRWAGKRPHYRRPAHDLPACPLTSPAAAAARRVIERLLCKTRPVPAPALQRRALRPSAKPDFLAQGSGGIGVDDLDSISKNRCDRVSEECSAKQRIGDASHYRCKTPARLQPSLRVARASILVACCLGPQIDKIRRSYGRARPRVYSADDRRPEP